MLKIFNNKENRYQILQVKYIGDTGWLDGTTHGEIYEVKQCEEREDAYTVLKNDLGGHSHLLKSKFINKESEDYK